MNAACALCKGACCESIIVPVRFNDADSQRWFELHGTPTPIGTLLECKCSKLVHGKCSIYESRPNVCKVFEPGSNACIDAVVRRRPFKADRIFKLLEEPNAKEES